MEELVSSVSSSTDTDAYEIQYFVFIVGCVLLFFYGLLFVIFSYNLTTSLKSVKRDQPTDSLLVYNILFFSLGLFLLVARMFWIILRTLAKFEVVAQTQSILTTLFISDRVGILIYFTTFSVALLFWIETFNKNYISATTFQFHLKKIVFVINSVIYALIIGSTIVYFSLFSATDTKIAFLVVCIIEGGSCIIASLGYLIFGVYFFKKERKAREYEKESKKELAKITVCTIVFAACFIIRGMFCFVNGARTVVNPFSNEFLPFTYFLPELIPLFVQLYIFFTTKSAAKEIEAYRKLLYDTDIITEGSINDDQTKTNSITFNSVTPFQATPHSFINIATSPTLAESSFGEKLSKSYRTTGAPTDPFFSVTTISNAAPSRSLSMAISPLAPKKPVTKSYDNRSYNLTFPINDLSDDEDSV